MSNIQKYIDTCNETAAVTAQRLRSMANVIGDEQHYEDNVCTIADVQCMTKRAIKRMATDMQNLVRTMGEQLAIERAEAERMTRLYEMARNDYREMRMQHAVLGTELDDLKGLNGEAKKLAAQAKAH